jgi:hypothetical protein
VGEHEERPSPSNEAPAELTAEEIQERLRARPDLLERLNKGDTTALLELLEEGTGAKVKSADIRLLA